MRIDTDNTSLVTFCHISSRTFLSYVTDRSLYPLIFISKRTVEINTQDTLNLPKVPLKTLHLTGISPVFSSRPLDF